MTKKPKKYIFNESFQCPEKPEYTLIIAQRHNDSWKNYNDKHKSAKKINVVRI